MKKMRITKMAFLAIVNDGALFIFREKQDNIWKLPGYMVLDGEFPPGILRMKFEKDFPDANVEIGDCIYSFLYSEYDNEHKHISLEREIFAIEVYSGEIKGIITEIGNFHSIETQYFDRKMGKLARMITGLLAIDGHVKLIC